MRRERFASVWDALENAAGDAANMKARSVLMMSLTEFVKTKGLSQKDAAKLFRVTQPRVSDLMRGKVQLFSLDTLVTMLAAAGFQMDLRVTRIGKKKAA